MGSIPEQPNLNPETTTSNNATPTLFQPIQIRGLTLRNRIVVSPMGMYSSHPSGNLTEFHLMHHGQFAFRGAALTIVEGILPHPLIHIALETTRQGSPHSLQNPPSMRTP